MLFSAERNNLSNAIYNSRYYLCSGFEGPYLRQCLYDFFKAVKIGIDLILLWICRQQFPPKRWQRLNTLRGSLNQNAGAIPTEFKKNVSPFLYLFQLSIFLSSIRHGVSLLCAFAGGSIVAINWSAPMYPSNSPGRWPETKSPPLCLFLTLLTLWWQQQPQRERISPSQEILPELRVLMAFCCT